MDAILYLESARYCLQEEIEEVAYKKFTTDVTNIDVDEEKTL